MTATAVPPARNLRRLFLARALATVALLSAAIAWLAYAPAERSAPEPSASPQPVADLAPGTVASMDSPTLTYSPGWRVASDGADPPEPAAPWNEPSGTLNFTYTGGELALRLAPGDYWGYLYVTVDGEPANLLPTIRGNVDSRGRPAGYRTFYAPEAQQDGGPSAQWQRIHRAADASRAHAVTVEVWRSWGQTPLRGIAVDALPPSPLPRWPGILLLAFSFAAGYPLAQNAAARIVSATALAPLRAAVQALFLPQLPMRTRSLLAAAAAVVAASGIALSLWSPAAAGLALLAYLSVSRPALWSAAVVFALPFYFSFDIPLPGGGGAGLIDILLLMGIAVAAANALLFAPAERTSPKGHQRNSRRLAWLLAALIAWALVAVFAADHFAVALREWRTVFLSAGLFAVLLAATLRASPNPSRDLRLIMAAWVTGGAVVAAAGLAQYLSGAMLISAEGVNRIRAFYGSPNNLALYLERTFLVALALAAFLPDGRARLLSALAAGLQGAALLLTFSKGALFLGVPAGIVTLWAGGLLILPSQGRSRRPLLWLGGVAALFAAALLPFLPTERFQRLLDFSQGTGYLRIQLWRSAWQMALDHPWLGVGPDNFLYAYRSFYLLPQAWQEPNLNHPHNWPLDWWTRLGIPGLALALAWFAAGIAGLWRRLRLCRTQALPRAAALNLGILAATVAALTHGLIDASYALPDLMLVWTLILMASNMTPEHAMRSGVEE